MLRSRFALLLLLPLLLLTLGFRQAPLVDPPPIHVPAGMTTVQVDKAIKAALAGRGWTVADEQAGQIESIIHVREHMAKIHISYDTQQIKIAYVDSQNLKYKVNRRGERLIHKNYLGWINYLVNDIGRDLELISVTTASAG